MFTDKVLSTSGLFFSVFLRFLGRTDFFIFQFKQALSPDTPIQPNFNVVFFNIEIRTEKWTIPIKVYSVYLGAGMAPFGLLDFSSSRSSSSRTLFQASKVGLMHYMQALTLCYSK